MSTPTTPPPYGLPFWLDIDRPRYGRIEHDITADVVVVGAGISGLKLARCLARYGADVVVVDAGRVGDGASGRNQGCITYGEGCYAEYSRVHSREMARQLCRLGLESHRLIREQIQEFEIECDYQNNGSFALVRPDIPGWEEQLESYSNDCALLREDGFDVVMVAADEARERSGSPHPVAALAKFEAAQFHSGKFVSGLARGISQLENVRLFEETRAQRIEFQGNTVQVHTPGGVVTAERAFLATNALVPQLVPKLERGLRAERGQVFVTEPLAERPCRGCFGSSLAWWREVVEGDGRYRLLFGGGRARDEPDSLFPQFTESGDPHPHLTSEGFSPSIEHQQRLDTQFGILFPHLAGVRITHRWGGLQSFTCDSLPMVGEFDPSRRVHGIAGYSGHGNCYADVAAEFLAGKAAGVKSDIELQYGPLMEKLLKPGRDTANWGLWETTHQVGVERLGDATDP